jgi:hypothetical protein
VPSHIYGGTTGESNGSKREDNLSVHCKTQDSGMNTHMVYGEIRIPTLIIPSARWDLDCDILPSLPLVDSIELCDAINTKKDLKTRGLNMRFFDLDHGGNIR